ncbi:non-hydrolyzing UDP-N-acetylglucosamine 2-epimerase [Rhodospirillum rubrum]|nr:UDP-N-acetylglucosamine 2-epimerase (non-hydrolyzing) [Rhodospirillum rubrum]
MTILGTRPELIRLSLILPRLDAVCDHVFVYTGQNAHPSLWRNFLGEFSLRSEDHDLGASQGTLGERVGAILAGAERVIGLERPDRVLILGDTNSGLSAYVAKRLGIPVFHMEAGNRCHDDRVPEEVNRRVIDHCSDLLMPYTEHGRRNLLAEGIPGQRIVVTGNPIGEVLAAMAERIDAATALGALGLRPGAYLLFTFHRQENVDVPQRLMALMAGVRRVMAVSGLPAVVSVHPRTRAHLEASGLADQGRGDLMLMEPFGFCDFVALEKSARCVLSDSGTVQEEGAILGVPTVTLRDVTERPETLETGSNILCGVDPEAMERAFRLVTATPPNWPVPLDYTRMNVADTVVRLLIGASLPVGR